MRSVTIFAALLAALIAFPGCPNYGDKDIKSTAASVDDDACAAACETTSECTAAFGNEWGCNEEGCCEALVNDWERPGDDDDDDDAEGDDDLRIITGVVYEIYSNTPDAGITVEAIDAETARPFSRPSTDVTDSEGAFRLEVNPGADVAFRTYGIDHIDTYFFSPIRQEGQDFILAGSTQGRFDMMMEEYGIEREDSQHGFAFGRILYSDGPVGCAIASGSGSDEAHYFDAVGLPSASRDISGENSENGKGTNPGRSVKDDPLSYYFIGSIPQGSNILRSRHQKTAGALSETWIFQNSITFQDIVYDIEEYPYDPTPTWCTN